MADLQPVIFYPPDPIVVTLVHEADIITVVSTPPAAPIIEVPVETVVVVDISTPPAPAAEIVVVPDIVTVVVSEPAETVVIVEASEIVVVTDARGPQGVPGTPTAQFFIAAAYDSTPDPNAYVFALECPGALTFDLPVNMAGSVAKAKVAATATTVFDIRKNGSSIGTLTFTAVTGAFALASLTSFQAGDLLEIVAPAIADLTLADLRITVAATRTS